MTGKKVPWTKLRSCAAVAVVLGQGCGGTVSTLDTADGATTPTDQGPLPDQFDATLVTGTLCMPSLIQTGIPGDAVGPQYPVRFTPCLYRCVTFNPDVNVSVESIWDCNSDCRVMLVPHVSLVRVAGQLDCNASQFVSPPPAECTNQALDWMISVPSRGTGSSRTYPTGQFRVTVPFMTLAQGQQYVARTHAGEAANVVLADLVGTQSYPSREFYVNFDPSYPAVASADQLGPGDCHALPAP